MRLPEKIDQKYQVLREIGRGGMGVVYEVKHLMTGERCALKVVSSNALADSEALKRFALEMKASSKIASEHVVRVIDAGQASELMGAPYFVMELLSGTDLETLLESGHRFSYEEVVDALLPVAEALDLAHRAGLVHRDIKPENIFLHRTPTGQTTVKILDFGLMKVLDASDPARAHTATGTILGTPLYMAPEQVQGDSSRIGPWTDVWALGMTAFNLLTGVPYWKETAPTKVLSEILGKPVAAPSTRGVLIADGFDEWFLTACHRDPRRRFESATEMVLELARIVGVRLEDLPGSAPRLSTAGITIDPGMGSGEWFAARRNEMSSRSKTTERRVRKSEEKRFARRDWVMLAAVVFGTATLACVAVVAVALAGARAGGGFVAASRPREVTELSSPRSGASVSASGSSSAAPVSSGRSDQRPR